jgi:hypothetical protein
MNWHPILIAAVLAAGVTSAPAAAGPHARDSDRAFQATQQGRTMPLPQLERRVIPFMGGADYLGPELNGGGTTRLKFMQNGRVIWVDVDGQGRIVRRSRDR